MKFTAHGAVSILNGIPCGIGASMGVSTRIAADFKSEGGSREVDLRGEYSGDDRLVRMCISSAFKAMGADEPPDWSISIDSGIPASKGLKSSSTVCNAVIGAVFAECGFSCDAVDAIRMGVDCARRAGVTVTGAFDDACASALGGVAVTDNSGDRLVDRFEIEGCDVAIHIPEHSIPKSDVDASALRSMSDRFLELASRVGTDPFGVLTVNGRLVAEALRIDDSVARMALSNGALAAGVSGTGPATSIVLPKGEARGFVRDLGIGTGRFIFASTESGP